MKQNVKCIFHLKISEKWVIVYTILNLGYFSILAVILTKDLHGQRRDKSNLKGWKMISV